MLKRVIDHIRRISFEVAYTVELSDTVENLTFQCYSPDGSRHKWVLRNVDTDSYMGTDHDFELRHFALAIYQIDSMPVCRYLKEEMGVTLPDVLDGVSDDPHAWVWSSDKRKNQVAAIADLVYETIGRLPHEIQDALVKIFRTEHSRALGVTHIADEFNQVDDILKLLQRQAEELEQQPTEPDDSNEPETSEPPKEKKKNAPPGTQLNPDANHEGAFFVPPHQSTREHELMEKQKRRDETEVPPEVAAAMAYTESAYKKG